MKNEHMLKLRYETDMPAGDQTDCYLSCNVRINKVELKKYIKTYTIQPWWKIEDAVSFKEDCLQRPSQDALTY